ncbi:MAG: hypothetical protein E7D41_02425, partial [Cutibacterium sp.]|nr:hypothetical protein [Cutibacterium sp.]
GVGLARAGELAAVVGRFDALRAGRAVGEAPLDRLGSCWAPQPASSDRHTRQTEPRVGARRRVW